MDFVLSFIETVGVELKSNFSLDFLIIFRSMPLFFNPPWYSTFHILSVLLRLPNKPFTITGIIGNYSVTYYCVYHDVAPQGSRVWSSTSDYCVQLLYSVLTKVMNFINNLIHTDDLHLDLHGRKVLELKLFQRYSSKQYSMKITLLISPEAFTLIRLTAR